MNPFDILGSLIQNGMGASKGRLDDTFGGTGGPGGGGLGGVFGGPGGSPGGGFPGGMFGGPGGLPGGPSPIDILKDVAGAILGGRGPAAGPGGAGGPFGSPGGPGGPFGSPGGTGAAGSGLMAILAALAAKAMGAAIQQKGSGTRQAPDEPGVSDDLASVLAGLRKAANPQEAKLVQDVATLTVRAMINAAKADGRIDQQEAQRLVGKLQEDGLTAEDQRFVREEIGKPMETDALVRAVPNQQIAAQIYLASVMAIDADTDVEKRYLDELAGKLGLNQYVVAQLHRSAGLA